MDNNKFVIPTYNKIADAYTKQYFNDLTDIPYVDKFLQTLPEGAKLLDIGCGPGTFTKHLKQKGFEVEGVDLSEEMIKIAKEKVSEVSFSLMDMRKLDYPDSSFDGLLVAYSLIHIASEEIPATLEGFNRILKPNGSIMIIAQGGKPDQIVDEPLKAGEKVFINFFTKERLVNFLKQAGFDIDYQEELPMQDADSLSDKVIYTVAKKT